jgi:hypothetical protein
MVQYLKEGHKERRGFSREHFEHDTSGSTCADRGQIMADIANAIYLRTRRVGGIPHKKFVCCPNCSFADVRPGVPDGVPQYETGKLLCYIEALYRVLRDQLETHLDDTRAEIERFEERVTDLTHQIDYFHHMDKMQARDKAVEREKREREQAQRQPQE